MLPQRPDPVFRTEAAVALTGIMAVYQDQAEASAKIPEQWKTFLAQPLPEIGDVEVVYGASPCTGDRKIHYLCGVAALSDVRHPGLEQLVLPAGEYAIFTVNDPDSRGAVWGWILDEWLPASGYRERSAPEFERFTVAKGSRTLGTPIELGVPIEPKASVTPEKRNNVGNID